MKHNQLVVSIFFYTCLSFLCLFFSIQVLADSISILTKKGPISYSVEKANTVTQQRLGLMYRKSIPSDHGMLFIFDSIRPISMWMKNTYIPLDMLFVDAKGIIRHIHENARPLDETIITCPIPVKYVIELNAGQVGENGIQIGNEMRIIQ